jgi:phosphoribosylglycinamide formyltransferase 2
MKNTDIRIFGKPTTRPYRRMAVVLVNDRMDSNVEELRKLGKNLASEVKIL